MRNERGQALAEFALVLPLILFFIAGIIEFGRAWNIKQAVTDAAREGARYAVVQDDDIQTTDDVKAKIEERLALACHRLCHYRVFRRRLPRGRL